jgi:hypothetical protein
VSGYTGYTDEQLVYGSATLDGSMYTDSMSISSSTTNTAATNFGFFLISKQTGLEGLDGILGFSPITDLNTGPSYVKFLYD